MDLDPTSWITDDWWSYLVVALVITGSAVFPPLPSETMLVTATGLALAGELSPVAVALATGAGSLGGDLVAYSIGRFVVTRREPQEGGRVASALDWIERRRDDWLPAFIAGGRFIPGGTTVIGLGSGALRYPAGRYAVLALLGTAVWVTYGFVLAAAGQAAAPDNPLVGVGIGLGLVLLLAGTVSLVNRVRRRRRAPADADTDADVDAAP